MRREGCPTVGRRSSCCSPGSPSCLRRALPACPADRPVGGTDSSCKDGPRSNRRYRWKRKRDSQALISQRRRWRSPSGLRERDGLCPTTRPGSRNWSPRWWTWVPPWGCWKLRADWMPPVAALAAAALPVVVVNPRQIRDFARATGTLAKTDALDAAVLAHFAEAVRPPVRPLREAKAQVLNSLAGRRHQNKPAQR